MTKLVRKLRPVDFWRIGEHESWFSDMAKEGLHFHTMGTHFARFIKGVPKEMEYRIEVTPKKEISDEQISMYEENGWDYISSFDRFHVFTSPKERHAVEIHTDPAEQFFTLQTLNKRLILSSIAVILLSALIIALNGSVWFMGNTPILRLVEGYIIQSSIASLCVFYSVFLLSKGMLAIVALRKKLKHGIPINHHAPWKKSLRRSAIINVAFITIALGSAYLPFKQLLEMDTISLPVEATDHKVIRLAELEQFPKLKRDEYFIDGVDFANRLSMSWSIVAPEQYEIDETYTSNESNETTLYNPSISSKVYELRMSGLVEPLVQDLIKWYSYHTKAFIKEQHATLNHLYIYEEDMHKEIIAAKGNVVTFVRYHGNTSTDVLVEKVAEKINE
jgi:hypothetical protein